MRIFESARPNNHSAPLVVDYNGGKCIWAESRMLSIVFPFSLNFLRRILRNLTKAIGGMKIRIKNTGGKKKKKTLT